MDTLLSSEQTIYRLGFQAYQADKYHDAIHYFRTLTMLDPLMPKYWMGLGACHKMLADYQEALKAYGVAAMVDETDPRVHMEAAKCLFEMDQRQEAYMALESAERFSADRVELALIKAKWDNQSPV